MCVRVYSEGGKEISQGGGEVPARVPWAGCLLPASDHTAHVCLRLGEAKARTWTLLGELRGDASADSLGWGCFHLWIFPLTMRLLPPPPHTAVLCQNGCCSWHLSGSLFFFPEALKVSTPILAHLPAESGGSSSRAGATRSHKPWGTPPCRGASPPRGQLR